MPYGSRWSEQFVQQLANKEVRSEYVADQMRARIAQLIRSLREQPDRNWTQAELGERASKPQNVISRFEDPDYGKMSLQSLFDIASAFDLPVWIDMPEWEDWLTVTADVPDQSTRRSSFDLGRLVQQSSGHAHEEPAPPMLSGAAASAAAEAVKNMIIGPTQMPPMLSKHATTNVLSNAPFELPVENILGATGNAIIARIVAA